MSEPPPRRATIDDAAALNALARAAYAVYVPVIGREPQPMATDWQTLFASQEIWIIDGPSGPIASLALEVEPAHVVIWSVAVLPEYQRKGMGRRLLDFAEARSRALGAPRSGCSPTPRWSATSPSTRASAMPRRGAKAFPIASSSI